MASKVSQLVKHLLRGNVVEGTRLFNAEMKDRIADALELRKIQVGKTLAAGKMHVVEGRSYVIYTDKIGKETKRGDFVLRTQMASGAGTEWVVLKAGKEIGYISKPKDTKNSKYPYTIQKFINEDEDDHSSKTIVWNAGKNQLTGTTRLTTIYGHNNPDWIGDALATRFGADKVDSSSGWTCYGTYKGEVFAVYTVRGEQGIQIGAPPSSKVDAAGLKDTIDQLITRAYTDGRKKHDTIMIGHTFYGIDKALRLLDAGNKTTKADEGEPVWK